MELLLLIHSLLRYVILLLAIILLVQSFKGISSQNPVSPLQNKVSLGLFISCHVMLLIGLIQYFLGANGIALFKANGAAVMKDSTLRFYAVEHILVMILGIACITIARISSKKSKFNMQRHKRLFYWTLAGLLLILSRIPWPFMQAGAGRGWL